MLSGLPFPPPGNLPNPGIEPVPPLSLALAGGLLLNSLGSPDWSRLRGRCCNEAHHILLHWHRLPLYVHSEGKYLKAIFGGVWSLLNCCNLGAGRNPEVFSMLYFSQHGSISPSLKTPRNWKPGPWLGFLSVWFRIWHCGPRPLSLQPHLGNRGCWFWPHFLLLPHIQETWEPI